MADLLLSSFKLSEDEQRIISRLRGNIRRFAKKNTLKHEYYEGKQRVERLGIAVPPDMQNLAVSVGWPGTVVDVLEERLHWQGWTTPTGSVSFLDEVYADNVLSLEASRIHLEALITGTGFITVGKGDTDAGEPEILVSVESSSHCTAEYDYRKRRISAALSQTCDDKGTVVLETLYLLDETILLERSDGRKLEVVDRNYHGLGRVPVARLRNRDRATDMEGRSEISRPVRYYSDAACRTLLGMEVHREFYQAPQRYALGAEPEQFGVEEDSTPDQKIMAGWRAAMGRLNVIPATEDGEIPQMGQFPSTPPTPFIEQIKAYSQMISETSGIPPTNLGFVTENPPSADSIRQAEYRLATRAERRQTLFGQAWKEVAFLATLIKNGSVDLGEFRKITPKWRDAFTPTRAAAADEALKLTSAGILPTDSEVTFDRIGLSHQEQATVRADLRRANVAAVVQNVRAAAGQASPEATTLAQRRVPATE
ncbi:phage portal protein [Nocardia salmonicida]|uniref:phage portal protein n=1 Tax=Nocardia salmonicida TaxID=53431 RepID=UPI003400560F